MCSFFLDESVCPKVSALIHFLLHQKVVTRMIGERRGVYKLMNMFCSNLNITIELFMQKVVRIPNFYFSFLLCQELLAFNVS